MSRPRRAPAGPAEATGAMAARAVQTTQNDLSRQSMAVDGWVGLYSNTHSHTPCAAPPLRPGPRPRTLEDRACCEAVKVGHPCWGYYSNTCKTAQHARRHPQCAKPHAHLHDLHTERARQNTIFTVGSARSLSLSSLSAEAEAARTTNETDSIFPPSRSLTSTPDAAIPAPLHTAQI